MRVIQKLCKDIELKDGFIQKKLEPVSSLIHLHRLRDSPPENLYEVPQTCDIYGLKGSSSKATTGTTAFPAGGLSVSWPPPVQPSSLMAWKSSPGASV